MSQPEPLNPLSLPLHGSRLIEASAGTGKTFTIALLYVRLVLGGHSVDDDTAFIRPLTPPEILVVTFTNAATQELRERIRNRLVEAADVFRAEDVEGGADPLLLELRRKFWWSRSPTPPPRNCANAFATGWWKPLVCFELRAQAKGRRGQAVVEVIQQGC